MPRNTLDDVKRDYREVFEFDIGHYGTYKRDKASCVALSRTLGVPFKAVYRRDTDMNSSGNRWVDDDISWCGETFYAVNPKGKVIVFYNSEWGGVEIAK